MRGDTIAAYAAALADEYTERKLFRAYMADSLRALGSGEVIQTPWAEVLHPKSGRAFDPEEIVSGLVARGLEVV